MYYYIPHRGTHREQRGLAIAAMLCDPLVACRPPGDQKTYNKPTLYCSGTTPPYSPSFQTSARHFMTNDLESGDSFTM